MSVREMCRWKGFWLGLVVLALTGWTWWRSMSCIDTIGYTTGSYTWDFSNSDGRVGALWGNYTYSEGSFAFSFGVPKPVNEPVMARWVTFERSGKDVMGMCLVAWWVVMLVEAVVWVGLLVWRAKFASVQFSVFRKGG